MSKIYLAKKSFLIVFFLVIIISDSNADTRVILPLRHAPEDIIDQAVQQANQEKILQSINNLDKKAPSKLSRKMVRGQSTYFKPSLSGFMSIYGGYIGYSNQEGIISFPLRHTSPKVYIAVTNEIRLIKVRGNTISHKEFIPNETPVSLYELEKKHEEKQNISYWSVKEITVPENNKINSLTIILLTKPKNIVIPPGDFLTNQSIQMVLPNIYVVGNVGIIDTTLKSLDYKHFFERINTRENKISDTVIQKMNTNI